MKIKNFLTYSASIVFFTLVCYAATNNAELKGNEGDFLQGAKIDWGSPVDGVRAGVWIIVPGDGYGDKFPVALNCNVFLQNIGTNIGSFRVIYNAELRGPDGKKIELRNGGKVPSNNWRKRTILRSKETSEIDFFSIPVTFEVLTNGGYQMIISVQTSTNMWGRRPVYSHLPAITNSFVVNAVP